MSTSTGKSVRVLGAALTAVAALTFSAGCNDPAPTEDGGGQQQQQNDQDDQDQEDQDDD